MQTRIMSQLKYEIHQYVMNQRNPVTLRGGVNHQKDANHIASMNQSINVIHRRSMNHPICANHFPCMNY